MILDDLIDELIRLGIHINAKDGQLKVQGDNITPQIVERIRANKEALLNHLKEVEDSSYLIADIPLAPKQENYVLSSSQIRLWVLSRFEGGNVAYNMPGAFLLEGDLNIAALEHAFQALVERHENLRTIFKEDENGDVKQYVKTAQELGFSIAYTDLRHEESQQEKLQGSLHWNNVQPFDLAIGPLLRAHLYQVANSSWIFSCVMHHIISDGWSVDILFNELFTLYHAFVKGEANPLLPLRIQYKDYAVWQQQQIDTDNFKAHKTYWLSQFEDTPPVLELPGDQIRPATKTFNGGVVHKQLQPSLAGDLKKMSQHQGATLFMGLLAGINALLYRYTGQQDIVLGSPTAGRDHTDLHNQIGFYVNTLALRTRFGQADSFNALLEKVKQVTLDAYKHQIYPFDELIEDLPIQWDMSHSPLFDIMVLLQDDEAPASGATQNLGDLQVSGYSSGDHIVSKFDLTFAFGETAEGLQLNIEYNTDIYREATVKQLADHLEQLLQQAIAQPDMPVGELDYLTREEKQYLLTGLNNTASAYDKSITIVDLIEAQVAATPNHIAVLHGTDQFTYQELNEVANRVAHYLRSEPQVKAEDLIGIQLERSEWMVAVMLGVLKSGAAYAPIDVDYPQERIDYLIKDSRCKFLIDATVLAEFKAKASSYDSSNPIKITKPNDLAYLIYTSGSTGQPKGVMIEHRNVSAFMHWAKKEYGQADYEVIFAGTSICFDISIFELFYTLTSGKQIRLLNNGLAITDYLGQHQRIMLNTVPSVVGVLLKEGADFSNVTILNMAGEAIPEHYAAHFDCNKVLLYNFYGPSEDTTYSTVYRIKNNAPILVGRPIDNSQVYIVSPSGQLCPVGVSGEIYIGGDGVSRGYLHRPEVTAEKFLDNPFVPGGGKVYKTGDIGRWLPDGNIALSGRLDAQVKVRGFRIELGEVEGVLQSCPEVNAVAVIALQTNEGKEMVAYITADRELLLDDVRAYLSNKLPSYMIPGYFVQLPEMPLTLNGKIDRKKLPEPQDLGMQTGAEYIAPRNETEAKLLVLWQKILNKEAISVKDNFFNLGGHSLKATRLATLIHKEFNVNLTLAILFSNPTIEGIAAEVILSQANNELMGVEQTNRESVSDLFIKLKKLKINIQLVDDRLDIQAPKGVLTPELVSEIKLHKTDLINFIKAYKTRKDGFNAIGKAEERENYPLSSSQRRMWIVSQFEDASIAYNMPGVYAFEGNMSREALEYCFDKLIDRHENLRTVFKVDTDGEAKQYIKNATDSGFKMGYVDVRDVPEGEREEKVKAMLAAAAYTPFDLAEGPLVRATLYRLEDEKWVFGFVMHHIISDGWSMGILISELMQLYTAYTEKLPDPLEPLYTQYKDYAVWQQQQLTGEQLQEHKGYWLKQFEGEIPVLDLPGDMARPSMQTYNGGGVLKMIGEDAGKGIKDLSQEQGGTLFMGLVAAIDVLLYKYTGQTDIVVGSQIAGRVHADLENQIGFYLNTLALRARFSPEHSFRQLLNNVKEVTLGAYEHQVYPFDELITALDVRRDMSRRPLFDISVVLQNADVNSDGERKVLGGLTITSFEGLETTNSLYDLAFDFTESNDEIQTSIIFNSDIYHEHTITQMMEHLEKLLLQVTAHPDIPICQLDFLTDAEKEQQLVTFNNTAADYPTDKTIAQLFEEQALATPDATAVVFEQRSLTYAELNEKANRLAKYLQDNHQVQPDDTVGIMLERSEMVIIAILGVLKSGAAYVPLDPEYPKTRKSFITNDTAVKAFITQTDYIFDIEFYNGPIIALDVQLDGMEAAAPAAVATQPNNLAYIMYTSGSTGVPKGVLVEQRSVVRLVKNTNYVQLSASDNVLSLSNFAFDGSTFDIYAALLNGGTVHVPLKDQLLDFHSLANIIDKNEISLFFITTALFNSLVDVGFANFSQLKYVLFGGERVSVNHVKKFRANYHNVQLVHVYGPTENTTFSTFYNIGDVSDNAVTVPIGSGIANSQCYILNATDHRLPLLPLGVVGEICVGGDGLAKGYLNQPELTAEKFVDNPFVPGGRLYKTGDHGRWLPDGSIEFTGRRDAQVKIRGHRIELGEIETALQQCNGVEAGVVVIRQSSEGEKEIAAYVVSKEQLNATMLATQLSNSLPAYMIPVHFVQLEELPLNANGKVDVKALPDPTGASMDSGVEYVAPRNATEEKLVAIWREVLDREKIGVKDNFFDLGGHSLKATKLASQIHKEFDVKIDLKDLFTKTTLEEQAALIDLGTKSSFVSIETTTAAEEGYILSSSQRRLWVLSQFQEGNVAYNMPGVYVFEGALDQAALQYAFDTMVARHESLRTIFKEDAHGEIKQYILPMSEAQTQMGYRDLRHEADNENLAKQLVQEVFVKPFNLATGPLIVGHLLQIADDKCVFVYCMHHIISDGWSMGILINELFVLYNAKINGQTNPLPPLRIQYKDFAAWQQEQLSGEDLNEHKVYWMNQFEGDLPVLDMPADMPRPILQTFNGAAQNKILEVKVTSDVKNLVQEEGGTMFMGVLAAVKALLHRYTNQDDIIVGSPIAGREHADLHDQIGFYVNTLVLRTQFSGNDSYRQLLRNVKTVTLGAYEHQVYPFDELIENLKLQRDTSRGALFDIMVAMQNNQLEVTGEQKTLGNLTVSNFDGGEFVISKFDMTFTFQEVGDQMMLSLEYNTDLFHPDTIERMGNHLEKLLTLMAANPDTSINELEFVTSTEAIDLLYNFNATAAPYDKTITVVDRFEAQVAQTPNNVALVFEGQEMTYQQLNDRANQLAHLLQQCGVTRGSYVGIVQHRSMDMVVSVFAIEKAGGTYVPFEPEFPRARIQGIAANLGIQVLLSHTAYSRVIEEIQYAVPSIAHVVYLDEQGDQRPVEKIDTVTTESLWDYIAEQATDEVTAGGFVSAYSGNPFTAAAVNEYVQHVIGLVQPHVNKKSTVVEIGCGSGLLMYPLAPGCQKYIGIDPSSVTQQKNAQRITEEGHTNIELLTGYADELPTLLQEKADVVLIASTTQFFPGLQYLKQTVAQALAMLKPGGKLIIADVLDLDKKQAFADSLGEYARNHPEADGKTKQSVEEELYVSAAWFEDLPHTIDGVADIQFQQRTTGFENELQYRSDVIITADEKNTAKGQPAKSQHGMQTVDKQPTTSTGFKGKPSDIAYVIYTSGSTGTPKGVYVKHQAVINLVEWVNRNYQVGDKDRVLFVTSLCFDLSVYDMFGVLSSGGSLRVVSSPDVRNAERLYEILTTEPITFWNSAPAAFNQLVPYMNEPVPNHLRLVFLSGDWIPVTFPDKIRATFATPEKPVDIISYGGATEATVWSNYFNIEKVEPQWASIPYGKPIQNSQYYVFNEKLKIQPYGYIGDLYIAGDCLAEGYANDPILTNSKYINNPYTGERMYKTGDLTRWWKNGIMEFIGRKDSQVKIRGYRIELGEIEAILLNHPSVDSGVVMARPGNDGVKELVAYVVSKQELNSSDLRGFLAKSLPAYMVPAHFVKIDAIPLTANGKVNLKALPKPEGLEISTGVDYVAPQNDTEEKLAAIWEDILGRKPIGRNDRFFDLGGNSLKATRLATNIHRVFEVKLGLRELFTKIVLHEQAEMVASAQKTSFIAIDKVAEQPDYIMSSSQRRLWVLSQFDEGNVAYNMPAAYVFDGAVVNKEALSYAFDELMKRHESLRTVFRPNDSGEIRQVIIPWENMEFKMEHHDLRAEADAEVKAAAIAKQDFGTPFALANGPLVRAHLMQLSDTHWIFVYNLHHIISDGWSAGIVIMELLQLYYARIKGQPNPLPPLGIQYKDFATWQRAQLSGGAQKDHRAYWLKQMEGELPVTELPGDRIRPAVKTYNGATHGMMLEPAMTNALRDLLHQQGGTLFMGLLTIVNTLMYRYVGQEDLIFGSPIAGRDHTDLHNQIGFYVNTLALRTKFKGTDSFNELLGKVKQVTLGAYEHQIYPFDELVDELQLKRDTSRSPLFSIMVMLNNNDTNEGAGEIIQEDLQVSEYGGGGHVISKFDLNFTFGEMGDYLQSGIEYNTDMYDLSTIERIQQNILHLLQGIIADPNKPINEIDYLSAEEKHQLTVDFNNTKETYPAGKTVVEVFEEQVLQTPDKIALQFEDTSFTYSQLNALANQAAHYLRSTYDIKADDVIALQLHRSHWLIIAILGILKAGAAYLPIDPDNPVERTKFMLGDTNSKLLIDEAALEQLVPAIANSSTENPASITNANSLVYIMYTSGSTGLPKGVMIEHAGVVRLVKPLSYMPFKGNEVLLSAGAISFDATTFEFWSMLLNGGTLVMCPREILLDTKMLKETMQQKGVNTMWFTPGWLNQLVDTDIELFENLQTIKVGGDRLSPVHIYMLKQRYPNLGIVNGYGPTENTAASCCYTIDTVVPNIPIGKPIGNTTAWIVDEYMQLVPIGVIGELLVGGVGVARGYLNNAELTAKKFIDNPFNPGERIYKTGDLARWLPDGNIEFIGRADEQVKIAGYRIEPGEIEAVLQKHPDIDNAIVVAKANNKGVKELVAYIVSKVAFSTADMRSHLGAYLPAYMLPAHYVHMEVLPLNAHGKVDKKALPDPEGMEMESGIEYVAPQNETEEKLVAIWEEVLERKHIGIQDNFFELGGTSIKIVKMVGMVNAAFEKKIAVVTAFKFPNIHGFAEYINSDGKAASVSEETVAQMQESLDIMEGTFNLLNPDNDE